MLGDHRQFIPTRNGTFHHPNSVRKMLFKVNEEADLERHVAHHRMRHTFNNLSVVGQGGPRYTPHEPRATPAMTKHYSHVSLEQKQEATALQWLASTCDGSPRF